MIEAQIEAKMVAALSLLITDVQVIGYWQEETTSTRKEPPLINVKCNPRSVEEDTLPVLSCSVEIEVLTPSEYDQKKLKIADWSEKVLSYLYTLNTTATAGTALSDTGYRVQGAFMQAGDTGFDTDQKANYMTTNLMVHFII